MANYARQDCGISVPDAQVADCVSDQRSPDTLERETCKNFGDVATIRTQWTCDDLAVYWDGAGAADEAGP
ncbi:MAG: hypothetical protein KTR31_03145 [Myxococcales bacterium]|nr:hypothetical protein [Myxococcales bacterium]